MENKEIWRCPFCGLPAEFTAEDSPCWECAAEYQPVNAGIYYQVEFLRNHFLAEDPMLSQAMKHDREAVMIKLQAKIQEYLDRELSDWELDCLV